MGGQKRETEKLTPKKSNVECRKPNDEGSQKSEVQKSEVRNLSTIHQPSGGSKAQNRKIDTQNIDGRFEQVRARILADAAFFVANGSVEATWRAHRAHRLGPYFRVRCRPRTADERFLAPGAASP